MPCASSRALGKAVAWLGEVMSKVPGMKAGSLYGAGWGKTAEEAAEVEKRQPRAFGFLEDGETVEVEFTRDNGERVIGIYGLVAWSRPPAKELATFDGPVKKRPMSVYSLAQVEQPPQPKRAKRRQAP